MQANEESLQRLCLRGEGGGEEQGERKREGGFSREHLYLSLWFVKRVMLSVSKPVGV